MLIGVFKDDVFPFSKMNQIRNTVRVFLEDNQGRYAVLRIVGEDIFGKRNHLETPGGGIEDGEEMQEALKREVKEELGYEIKNITEIGTIIDMYNVIHRITQSTFFYASLVSEKKEAIHLTELEKTLFKGVEWYSLDELLKLLDPKEKSGVEFLVNQRDYCACLKLKEMKEKDKIR